MSPVAWTVRERTHDVKHGKNRAVGARGVVRIRRDWPRAVSCIDGSHVLQREAAACNFTRRRSLVAFSLSAAVFIAQRPEEDRRVVAVPQHHVLRILQGQEMDGTGVKGEGGGVVR
jgi:hypothetical protein